jgi:hypothetical protein
MSIGVFLRIFIGCITIIGDAIVRTLVPSCMSDRAVVVLLGLASTGPAVATSLALIKRPLLLLRAGRVCKDTVSDWDKLSHGDVDHVTQMITTRLGL